MSRFNVDFNRLAIMLLPTFMRKELLCAIARVVLLPINIIHGELMRYRTEVDYGLAHNGQTCKLIGLLNDTFGKKRHIRIRDVQPDDSSTCIYVRAQRKGLMLPIRSTSAPNVIGCRGYTGVKTYDFEIAMFDWRGVDTDRLVAIVNANKLAGKRFRLARKL